MYIEFEPWEYEELDDEEKAQIDFRFYDAWENYKLEMDDTEAYVDE